MAGAGRGPAGGLETSIWGCCTQTRQKDGMMCRCLSPSKKMDKQREKEEEGFLLFFAEKNNPRFLKN